MALLLLLGTLSSAAGQTMPSDKEALLGFKASVIDNGLVLASWTNDTDPCIDQWTGISCTCYPFFEESGAPKRVPSCTPLDWTGDGSRVLQINFGDLRINDWNFLGGNLPAWLGNLTALRVLNLKNNNFTGEIPSQWSKLTNLEQLILAGNNITGELGCRQAAGLLNSQTYNSFHRTRCSLDHNS